MDKLKTAPALEAPTSGKASESERPSSPYLKPELKLYGNIRPCLLGSPPDPPAQPSNGQPSRG